MKTVVIGDVHGRSIWSDILNHEQPDKTIFLGDYVTSHEGIGGEEQLNQLSSILKLKRDNPSNIVLLRGNHDLDVMPCRWAECFPRGPLVVRKRFSDEAFRNEFLELTQWVHVIQVGNKPVICSHAGVSKSWLELLFGRVRFDEDAINTLPPSESFGFNLEDLSYRGDYPKQPCTWIRPRSLQTYAVDRYDQIVGHTPTMQGCSKMSTANGDIIFLCDSLANRGYLVIENDCYIPKFLDDIL